MAWLNYASVLAQLEASGIDLGERGLLVDTARIVRCRVRDRKGSPGWYRVYSIESTDGSGRLLVGSFGVASGADPGAPQKILIDREDRPRLSAEQLAAIRAAQLADRRASEARQRAEWERCAMRATRWWRKCGSWSEESGESAYLTRKGLPPGRLYGARLSPGGNLVIPLQDVDGKTHGLQVIYHDPAIKARKGRDKDFAPAGLAKKGHFFVIGTVLSTGDALMCEGFATGATLHEATALPVVVAFDAGNLLPVAQAIRKAFPRLRVTICADDDYDWQQTGKANAGIAAAQAAAMAIQASVVFPIFPGERPLLTHKGPTDFNDLCCHPDGGLAMVARQVQASLSAAAKATPKQSTIRAAANGPGGGDSAAREPLRANISVEEALERWSLIYGAPNTFFDHHEHLLVAKSNVLDLLPDHGFRDWKRSGLRVARITEVGFDPAEKDERITCNLWGGWPTTPVAGKCDMLLDLLRFLCSAENNSQQAFEWVLKWLAYPIQHPGAKMRTALVFHGEQGGGKNLFFETYMAIYGDYGRVIDQNALEEKFNDCFSRKLFLVADEVVARNELYHLKGKLKGIITGEWIRINPKQVAAYDEKNHVNLVFLSNEYQPAVVEAGDRRHFIIWTPDAISQAFISEIAAEIAAGGRAALHHYLLHLDLGDFDEHAKPPMTDAKRAVQELSAGSIERFFAEWSGGDTDWPACPCSSGQLYRAYSRYSIARGEKPRSQNQLSGFVIKQRGWLVEHKHIFDTAHYSGQSKRARMVLPPESVLQHPGAGGSDDHRKRPDQKEAQWMTDCFFKFQAALGVDP